MFLVVDNEFNRANYPDLIYQRFENPPGFAAVIDEEEAIKKFSNKELVGYWNALTVGCRCAGEHTLAKRLLGFIAVEMDKRNIPHESGKRIVLN